MHIQNLTDVLTRQLWKLLSISKVKVLTGMTIGFLSDPLKFM